MNINILHIHNEITNKNIVKTNNSTLLILPLSLIL